MISKLSGLLSDKVRRPIIINGKLLTRGDSVLMLKRERYHVYVVLVTPGLEDRIMDDGDKILNEAAAQSTQSLIGILKGQSYDKEHFSNFYANVDPYTGAIVLKNELYNMMLDKGNEFHFHDGMVQFQTETRQLIDDFNKNFIMNYLEVYTYLLNRRLMASHMPVKVKGHLVAGLFQPLVVGTKHIDCPLRLEEFAWFFEAINSPVQCEKRLEGMYETTRGLELSAIAMCDFASKFHTQCMRGLNRLYFQFILYYVLLDIIQPNAGVELIKRFRSVYKAIETERPDTVGVLGFLADCNTGIRRCRSALVTY